MTMPFIFNTLAYANKLVETGMSKEQAEAQSLALLRYPKHSRAGRASSSDLIARIEAASLKELQWTSCGRK
jgi:hypothetical protein